MEKETKILVGKIILGVIAAAGVVAIAVVAGNAIQAVKMFDGKKERKYHLGSYVNRNIRRLKNRGMIKFERRDGKSFVMLTEKGQKELLKYQLREVVIRKPKRWDKKWRVLIFDIKEKRKIARDELRRELANLGFVRLQNSVWVHPYECEEVIIMLKSYFRLGKDVLYLVVERIENDRWLKENFGL